MVQHSWSLQNIHLDRSWLTIGAFDGVHLGHQVILRSLRAGAHTDKAPAVVLTFNPQPAIYFKKRPASTTLSTPEERVIIMGDLGIDLVITFPFDQQTAETTAEEFLERLKDHLGFTWLSMGVDFALGNNRQGDVNFLSRLADKYDYQLQVFAPVELDGKVISSSRIRSLLSQGDVRTATRMLGRPYKVAGEIVHGDGRGRTIGFPTANLLIDERKLVPDSGVYACRAKVGHDTYAAAVNVGFRPTFGGDTAISWVEAHLIDYSDDLYGQRLELEFIERLRGEQRFSGVQELLRNIHDDINKTRKIVPI